MSQRSELKPKQVVPKFREIKVKVSQGKDALATCRETGATDEKVIGFLGFLTIVYF